MKQPELGRKISDLRKQKGLTQEELVEQCNINVRTIQRIEAGEVTPRSFTLKTILNALGEDLGSIQDSSQESYDLKEASLSLKQIKIAWICGLIYFLLGFVEFAVDYARFYKDNLIISKGIYISIKFVILITFLYFMLGFVRSGNLFNSYLLKIGAFFLMGTMTLFSIYDMASLYFNGFYIEYVLITQSIFFGIGGFILGFALLQWKAPLGIIPKIAGGFELGAGVMFVLVFMAWLGYLFMMPAIILEIILLYKIAEFIKTEKPFES